MVRQQIDCVKRYGAGVVPHFEFWRRLARGAGAQWLTDKKVCDIAGRST
jgi:hypothetical protein